MGGEQCDPTDRQTTGIYNQGVITKKSDPKVWQTKCQTETLRKHQGPLSSLAQGAHCIYNQETQFMLVWFWPTWFFISIQKSYTHPIMICGVIHNKQTNVPYSFSKLSSILKLMTTVYDTHCPFLPQLFTALQICNLVSLISENSVIQLTVFLFQTIPANFR